MLYVKEKNKTLRIPWCFWHALSVSRVQILSRTTIDILLLEKEKKLGNALQKAGGCETAETAAVAIGAKWLVNKLEHCGCLGYDKSSSVFTIEICRKTRKLGIWRSRCITVFSKLKMVSGIKYKYLTAIFQNQIIPELIATLCFQHYSTAERIAHKNSKKKKISIFIM